jgi:flagellar FliJ protein
VLAYRRFREEQELRRLAEAYRLRRQAEQLLADYRQEMEREQERIAACAEGVEEWQHFSEYLEALAERLRAQKERVAGLREEVSRLEKEAIKAAQEREILERLKARRLAAARYEEGRREQREIDELALVGYRKS